MYLLRGFSFHLFGFGFDCGDVGCEFIDGFFVFLGFNIATLPLTLQILNVFFAAAQFLRRRGQLLTKQFDGGPMTR